VLVPPDPPLTDGVVALRAWSDADAGAIAAMMEDPEIARWTQAPSPYRERDAVEWLALHPALLRRGEELPLAVVDAQSGELAGSMSVRFRGEGRGEFGYLMAAGFRGRGLGTRALRLFASWAFQTHALARLEVLVQPENEPSLAMAERAGFVREGVLRSYKPVRGRRVDMVMLALLRSDYEKSRAMRGS
jgi:RimJ/RimL family protein N-acetyltransferase